MSQNSSPQNVPSATQGEAVSVAAPGLVGAGGTNCPHCGRTLIPSADVFDRIAGFPFEKCACQLEGTTLEDFQRWLETKANEAHALYFQGPEGETLWQEVERCKPVTLLIAECRVATKLLMQFKLEQSK